MRNYDKPTIETTQQFRDKAGDVWRLETYYPKGKRNGNDRYWIATLINTTTGKSEAYANEWHLERALAHLKAGQRSLF